MLQQVQNSYFTEDEINNSPSRLDGIDADLERRVRFYGCELINNAGILLRLPQVCMCTSQVLLHLF